MIIDIECDIPTREVYEADMRAYDQMQDHGLGNYINIFRMNNLFRQQIQVPSTSVNAQRFRGTYRQLKISNRISGMVRNAFTRPDHLLLAMSF